MNWIYKHVFVHFLPFSTPFYYGHSNIRTKEKAVTCICLF